MYPLKYSGIDDRTQIWGIVTVGMLNGFAASVILSPDGQLVQLAVIIQNHLQRRAVQNFEDKDTFVQCNGKRLNQSQNINIEQ